MRASCRLKAERGGYAYGSPLFGWHSLVKKAMHLTPSGSGPPLAPSTIRRVIQRAGASARAAARTG